eukprot:2767148-Karenia_brevis.AAC.1
MRGGIRRKSRVVALDRPPMIKIDLDNTTVVVNQSKIGKNPNPWHDEVIPGVVNKDGVPTLPAENEEGAPSAPVG